DKTVRLQFQGVNPGARISGAQELAAKVNYLIGNNPANWHTNVPTFSRIQVEDVYPGIQLAHYGNQRQWEYDFVVAPGTDPGIIRFRICGADQIEIDTQGDLVLSLGSDQIRQRKPVIYQIDHDVRKQIQGGYRFKDKETVAFEIGSYNHELPLIIDPVLSYSSFLGGLGNDAARAIALDNSGNIYVAGDTFSTQLGTAGAYQPAYVGGYPGAGGDAFVAKFDATGTNLLYLTYLGGTGDDSASSLALDPQGNVYLTGVTDSTNFPTSSL